MKVTHLYFSIHLFFHIPILKFEGVKYIFNNIFQATPLKMKVTHLYFFITIMYSVETYVLYFLCKKHILYFFIYMGQLNALSTNKALNSGPTGRVINK